ncbi:hypothetical protein [Dactylosporangium sp. NPDC050588]|uniref:hypothetical protein n=1 Tax=Dactylosporangium sp. NPDC050588 TaxID=3157211 RepID=UPI00340219CC
MRIKDNKANRPMPVAPMKGDSPVGRVSRRIVMSFITCALAAAGLTVATATPASAACSATIANPARGTISGNYWVYSTGATQGCGTGPWEVVLFRSRWYGWEELDRTSRWSNDGSNTAWWDCDGTHDYRALLQKNGVNYRWSSTLTISC